MTEIGFDVIGDLNLSPNDSFNWENKATSLYCILTGNISSDIRTVTQTLAHMARFYQGVFYVPGSLEYEKCVDIRERTEKLIGISNIIPNIQLLYHRVVIINGVAILGTNCWNNEGYTNSLIYAEMTAHRFEDIAYLRSSLQKLQRHLDVKKIILVTNAVPNEKLYFGEAPKIVDTQIPIDVILPQDTEQKITHWVFGSYNKFVDVVKDNIHYINNPLNNTKLQWAKRISVEV
jgi:hypothetical protein